MALAPRGTHELRRRRRRARYRALGWAASWSACLTACGVPDDPQPAPALPSASAPSPSPSAVVAPPSGSGPDLSAPPPETARLGFVGDVNVALSTGRIISAQATGAPVPPDVAAGFPFAQVRERIAAADLLVGNLECAVGTEGEPVSGRLPFRAPTAALPLLREAGLDVLSIANNHSSDAGPIGFVHTARHVRDAGLGLVGDVGGFDVAEQPALVRQVRGLRVAVLAYAAVPPAKACADVRRAKAAADLVVVYNHWGMEGCPLPTDGQIRLAHALVDAGATVVVGTHAHLLQPEERYRGGLIHYGLGDFVFAGNPGIPHLPGAYLEIDVERSGVRGRRLWRVEHDPHGAPHWIDSEPVEPQQLADAPRVPCKPVTLRHPEPPSSP